MEDHLAISLSQIPLLQYRNLLKDLASPSALLAQTDAFYQAHHIHPRIAARLKHPDDQKIQSIIRWMQTHEYVCITDEHPDYPKQLQELPCAPPVLYAIGNIRLCKQALIAIVGSRNASHYGLHTTKQFTQALIQQGYGIVSGLAIGIDTIAHQTCIDAQATTVAIIGLGLDNITPQCNRKLAEKIKEKGCILTEMPPQTPYQKPCFPRRNRLISALSIATLIPEATIASGTMITAQYSIDLHRPVMAVPGRIDQPQAAGCHQLIQTGAHLVTQAQDCLDLITDH